jgi:hypothetical protein
LLRYAVPFCRNPKNQEYNIRSAVGERSSVRDVGQPIFTGHVVSLNSGLSGSVETAVTTEHSSLKTENSHRSCKKTMPENIRCLAEPKLETLRWRHIANLRMPKTRKMK